MEKTSTKKKNDKVSYQCEVCPKQFSLLAPLKIHMSTHKDDCPFLCEQCPYRGKNKKYLSRHVKMVHSTVEKPYGCDLCNKRFLFRCKLAQHMLVHSGVKPCVCSVCGKGFNTTYSLSTHMFIHTEKKPFRCSYCAYACRDSSSLRKHEQRHAGVKQTFRCNLCNKLYKTKSRLKIHVAESHLDLDIRKHQCEFCKKKFVQKNSMEKHINCVHGQIRPYVCLECNYSCSNSHNLKMHQFRKHQHTPKEEYLFACDFQGCGKSFKDNSTLKKHSIIHRPEEHTPCPVCGRKFSRNARLEKHMLLHTKTRVKATECDVCGARFYNERYLTLHFARTHNNTQRYECDECGFQSLNKPGLVVHIRGKHSRKTKRWWTCDICQEGFQYRYRLATHMEQEHTERIPPLLHTEVVIKEEPIDIEEDDVEQLLEDLQKLADHQESLQQQNNTESSHHELSADILVEDSDAFLEGAITREQIGTWEAKVISAEDVNIRQNARKSVMKVTKESRMNYKKVLEKNMDLCRKKFALRDDTEVISERIKEKRKVASNINYNEDSNNGELDPIADLPNIENSNNKYILEQNSLKIHEDSDKDITNTVNTNLSKIKIDDYFKTDVVYEKSKRLNNVDCLIQKKRKTIVVNNQREKNIKALNFSAKDRICIDKDVNNEILKSSDIKISDSQDESSQNNDNIDELENVEKIKYKDVDDDSSDFGFVDDDNDPDFTCKKRKTKLVRSSKRRVGKGINLKRNSRVKRSKTPKIKLTMVNKDSLSEMEVSEKDGCDKSKKFQLHGHQCYVCFKLYPTKDKLLEHCQEHFDVCSDRTLKKCPLCTHVTAYSMSRHLKLVHNIKIKMPYTQLQDSKNNSNGSSRYYYNLNHTSIKKIEVIPTIKYLNKLASTNIDKVNRENKDKYMAKTKLVRKGKEWIVEREKMDINKLSKECKLPKFSEEELKEVKFDKNEPYLEKMKKYYKLVKKRNSKMLFPCEHCSKICQTLSALKLHYRKHEANPKPFKPKIWKHKQTNQEVEPMKKTEINIEHRQAKPQPIKNNHKCDNRLKEFYKNNIRGGDIEFWQFLKIYNLMDRKKVNNFEDLTKHTEFGFHTNPDFPELTNDKNINENDADLAKTLSKNNRRNRKILTGSFKTNTNININKTKYKRVSSLSKVEYKKRMELKNLLRQKNQIATS